MKQTINDLWNGEIHPYSDYANKVLPEIEIKKFIDSHGEFMGALDQKGRGELFELINSLEMVWREACGEAFENGFSLGVRLTSESLVDKK